MHAAAKMRKAALLSRFTIACIATGRPEMTGSISWLFRAVFVTGMVLAGSGAAYAFEITQPIPNTSDSACLDVRGSKTANATPIDAYPCNDGFNEQWNYVDAFVQGIGTTGSKARCLSTTTNTIAGSVELGGCGGSTPGWYFADNEMKDNVGGLFCLDSRGKYGANAQVVIRGCTGSASQIWVMKDIVITQPIPKTADSACVDVRGGAIADGTAVDAYPCAEAVNERWTYVDHQLQGVTTNTVKTCLGETTGGAVQLQTCDGSKQQQWLLMPYYFGAAGTIIMNATSGPTSWKCLDSQGEYGGTAQLVLTVCNVLDYPQVGAVSQIWELR
jgi:hypothetical protein